jgi:hypothetical protein
VLRDAGGHALEVVGDLRAGLVVALEPDGHRSLDWHRDPLDGEAALVFGLDLVALRHESRVDEDVDLVFCGREHEHAAQNTDLGRGEPDPVRVLHQLPHALGQTPEVVVELLGLARLHTQDRVGILADLRQRKPAPRKLLGVELFVPNLSLDLGDGRHTSGVERREREAIMRQGVSRAETPRDRREREALDEDMRENPLAGEPIRRRLRNFGPDAAAHLSALGGPLAWMRRLRAIEVAVALHEQQLAEARDSLREAYADDPARFARVWHQLAQNWDFGEVNDLIERHNRNYPAESRLPMNPRTGDFVLVNGRPYQRKPLDGDWILERFPAD